MNHEHNGSEPDDGREVRLTMRALQCDEEAELDGFDDEAVSEANRQVMADTSRIAGVLRNSYEQSPLPAASEELRAQLHDALDEVDNDKVTSKEKDKMSLKKGPRSSGIVGVLLASGVVAVAIMLLMKWHDYRAQQLAEAGGAIASLDQSYQASSSPDDGNSRPYVVTDDSSSMSTSNVTVGLDPHGAPTADYDIEFNGGTTVQLPALKPTPTGRQAQGSQGSGSSGKHGRWTTEYTKRPAVEANDLPVELPAAALQDDLVQQLRRGTNQGGVKELVERLEVAAGEGRGPDRGGDQYDRIYENAFKAVGDHPLSTFSIDVDTASYSKVRQYLLAHRQLPPPDAVRIEELVNYFPYDYLGPMGAHPFAAHMEVSECPWRPEHRLARIAIKGREIKTDRRPLSNLVFLLDVSGSMNEANKLPLVIKGMKMLVGELGENDRVAIVVYAGAAGLVLPSTSGDEKETILAALDKLQAGGSTAGAEGIKLAYQTARDNFIDGGVNRVLLCTDGDFNVGVSDTGGLVRMAEEEAKNNVFLSILGFGMGNHNDSMLEQVSGKANGAYAFIDTEKEARKVLVEQLSGTLVTIAKDVKIQVEFNPAKVQGYRLIGYENRVLAAEDFNDDKKDAGEIGAGHTVTALYEIVPADAKVDVDAADVDALKYQRPAQLTDEADSDELLTLKLRYKQPDGDKSTLISFPVDDNTQRFSEATDDFQFAAAVASFGMLLRDSAYSGNATYDAVSEIAAASVGEDEWGYRSEFLELVKQAKELSPKE